MALGLYRNPESRPRSGVCLLPQTPTICRRSCTGIYQAPLSKPQVVHQRSKRDRPSSRLSNGSMDVLRRSPKRRNRIEPRNRPRYRGNLGHPSWYHILPETCRSNATPGSEIRKQALSAADRVEEFVKDLRLFKRRSDYGIEKNDLPSIAKEAAGPEEYSMALEVLQAIF